MSGFIDLTSPTYSNLSQFAILASATITGGGPPTIVNSGYWGSTNQIYSDLSVGTLPSGPGTLSSILAAQNELATLIFDINTYTNTLGPPTPIPTPSPDITLLPNINYTETVITLGNVTINFDAGGNSDAQFL
jgi:hypothetical protein